MQGIRHIPKLNHLRHVLNILSCGTHVKALAVLLERNFHFGITARRGCIHGGYDPFNVVAQSGPLLIADHHKRDFATGQVLLVTHVFVGRQQKLETFRLSCRYELAVSKSVPSAFYRFNNDVALEGVSKRSGGAVIEEYGHRPLGRAGREARPDSAPRIRSPLQPVHATNETTP